MPRQSEPQPERILASRDATLRALIKQHGPCPLVHEPGDPTFALISAIIGQQISTHAARGIRTRFMERFSEDTRVWPAKIRRSGAVRLRRIGLSRTKAGAIATLARAIDNGELDFAALAERPDAEVRAELTSYKGVGPWTAEMFMLFGLRRLDIFTLGDLGLKRGIQIAYGLRKLPSERRLNDISRPWKPYRGIASWYLWRVAG